jgi:hypothetical protein
MLKVGFVTPRMSVALHPVSRSSAGSAGVTVSIMLLAVKGESFGLFLTCTTAVHQQYISNTSAIHQQYISST